MRKVMIAVLLVGLVGLLTMPIGAQEKPRTLKAMIAVLDDRLVNVEFKEKPLAEILGFFTEFTGVNLVVSPILREEKDESDLQVTLKLQRISVKSVLEIILDLKGLAAVYRHGVIIITTPKDARGKPVLRIYAIGDLTVRIKDFPAPDMMLKPSGAEDFGAIGGIEEEGREHAFAEPEFILDLVTENTGSGSWDDEGVSISVNRRMLVVRTYKTVHREVAALLDLLRAYR